MRVQHATWILAVFAGFLGGALSSRLLTVPSAEASGTKTFDSLTTAHLIITGDIVVQSTATRPFVLKDGNGNSLEFLYTAPPNPAFYLAIKNAMTARTDIPAAVLSENGVAIIRNAGNGVTFGAQLSPERLAMTYSDQSKAPWSTASTTLTSNSVDVSFDDSKPADLIHSTLNSDGVSYTGHGKNARLPQ
jgi:hypothetical protein